MKMTSKAMAQRKAAANARWAGRGKSRTIRVDADVAKVLLTIPEKCRREFVSTTLREAIAKKSPGGDEPTGAREIISSKN